MAQTSMITIGGACGFWGESDMALAQFLEHTKLDYIVFDYLAEVTLSIMARAREKDASRGYAVDFVTSVLKPNLSEIARQGVKIISNAGGINPLACAQAVRTLAERAGLDLKVAVVLGDDLLEQTEHFASQRVTDMFSGDAFPDVSHIASINAYLGAAPIAKALDLDADIVVTGRCVDSALTLGPCIHEFGWALDDWDRLSAGSLAGHIIECGPQATGGNFTDWEEVVEGMADVGYPIAEVSASGDITITKPANTGGMVSIGTVGEQILYEIGDPSAYILPDVTCDFSNVKLHQTGKDRVAVTGAKGYAAPSSLKVSATYNDGWRAGTTLFFIGANASQKAEAFANITFQRAHRKLKAKGLPEYSETLIELVGDGSAYGPKHRRSDATDVALKIAVKHELEAPAELLLREATGLALAAPPGLSNFGGNRSRPSPVVRLFSFLVPKSVVVPQVELNGDTLAVAFAQCDPLDGIVPNRDQPSMSMVETESEVPLSMLAWARSGDKGDKANIGILPRDDIFGEWIWRSLTLDRLHDIFGHYLNGTIERFYMPGTSGMNIVLDQALGGGGIASLRNDPQGKTYAQLLLQTKILLPATIATFIRSE